MRRWILVLSLTAGCSPAPAIVVQPGTPMLLMQDVAPVKVAVLENGQRIETTAALRAGSYVTMPPAPATQSN